MLQIYCGKFNRLIRMTNVTEDRQTTDGIAIQTAERNGLTPGQKSIRLQYFILEDTYHGKIYSFMMTYTQQLRTHWCILSDRDLEDDSKMVELRQI